MGSGATLKWVVQLLKDVPKAARFYSEGLDFTLHLCTLRWAHLHSGPSQSCPPSPLFFAAENTQKKHLLSHLPTCLLGVGQCDSVMQKGYCSMLSFNVPDLHGTVTKLTSLGAELDGPIKYEIHGKVAAMRCLDGHIIGLYEPL